MQPGWDVRTVREILSRPVMGVLERSPYWLAPYMFPLKATLVPAARNRPKVVLFKNQALRGLTSSDVLRSLPEDFFYTLRYDIGMEMHEYKLLAPYTTFRIGGLARYFFVIEDQKELQEAFAFITEHKLPWLVLGGGSNVLVSDNGFNGAVLKINIRGIDSVAHEKEVIVRIGAGEVLDSVIEQTVANNLCGLENLSAVPGLCGGLAIQNVGAYGVQVGDSIEAVEVFDTQTQSFRILTMLACHFGYRSSVFNTHERGRYIVTAVHIRLHQGGILIIAYPDLEKYFVEHGGEPTAHNVRAAVMEIRNRKLPNPALIGNAGSFFKNIIVTESVFQNVLVNAKKQWGQEWAQRIAEFGRRFTTSAGIKLPTAMFVEALGYKGMCHGGAQVHPNHALILTNPVGKATARNVIELAQHIRDDIQRTLDIKIQFEPELIGFDALTK